MIEAGNYFFFFFVCFSVLSFVLELLAEATFLSKTILSTGMLPLVIDLLRTNNRLAQEKAIGALWAFTEFGM
jgi:hypothetical protein